MAGQGREVRELGAKGVVQEGLPAAGTRGEEAQWVGPWGLWPGSGGGRTGVRPEMQVFVGIPVLPALRPGALVAGGCGQHGLVGLLVFQQEVVAKGVWKCSDPGAWPGWSC